MDYVIIADRRVATMPFAELRASLEHGLGVSHDR